MSQTYPEYTGTNFPDAIDNWDRRQDPDLAALPFIKQYSAAMDAGNLGLARELLDSNHRLQTMIINADSENQKRDAILAMQNFYFKDFQEYLIEIVKYKQEYNPTQKYRKYHVVYFLHQSVNQTYMCISNSTPVGNLPIDLNYWVPLTLQGEKGASGTGLSSRGAWDVLYTYVADDMVAWNNALWGAVRENVGVPPKITAVQDWYLIMEFDSNMLTLLDDESRKRYKMGITKESMYYRNEQNNTEDSKIYMTKQKDFSELKQKVDTLQLKDSSITITDKNNHFESLKLDGALDELYGLTDVIGRVEQEAGVEIEKLRKLRLVDLPLAGWSTSVPYKQTIVVPGISVDDNPLIYKYIADNATLEQAQEISEAFSCLTKGKTSNGSITFTCFKNRPVANMKIYIKGV